MGTGPPFTLDDNCKAIERTERLILIDRISGNSGSDMTLNKDLVEITERVQKGDFVLRLSAGVQRAEETLRDYVLRPN